MAVSVIQFNSSDLLSEKSDVDVKEIVLAVNNLEVKDEASFKKITSFYAKAKEWEKKIECLRKEANRPFQDEINFNNDKAKTLLDPLRKIQEIAKEKSSAYRTLLEENKKEEEKNLREAAETIGCDMPLVDPVSKSIRGDGALACTRTVRKFRIADLTKVPLEYLQINEKAVDQAIKLGISDIPGIEIFETKETILRTR